MTFMVSARVKNGVPKGQSFKLQKPHRDWLIDYLRFYVPLQNFSLILRRHHCRWRAAKFKPMLGAQGLWAWRDLYRVTPAVTRGLGFSGLIRRTAPFSRLLRHTRGCGGSILTRILTGDHIVYYLKRKPLMSAFQINKNFDAMTSFYDAMARNHFLRETNCTCLLDESMYG
jgi:hypothetical protein